MVQLLLENGALPNIMEVSGTKSSPLHHAVSVDCPTCISLLIRFGANTKSRDAQGFMPLHSGIVAGHSFSIEALIQGGADPMAVWQKNYKPLHLAV